MSTAWSAKCVKDVRLLYDTLVDTDVLIWYLRGNREAYKLIHALPNICISSVTYMELVQGMRNKNELRLLQKTLRQWNTKTIYINEEIAAKALFMMEEYFLSHSLQLADALIGATATLYGMTLVTANDKHYRIIGDLQMQVFRP